MSGQDLIEKLNGEFGKSIVETRLAHDDELYVRVDRDSVPRAADYLAKLVGARFVVSAGTDRRNGRQNLEVSHIFSLDHDRLFVGIKSYASLQPRGFQKGLKGYLKQAGLRTSITPHTLRHTFATVMIEKGANVKAVSQILGHSNCQITIDLYTHLSSEHLRAVMQRCNPLSKEVIPIEERIEMRKKYLPYLEETG